MVILNHIWIILFFSFIVDKNFEYIKWHHRLRHWEWKINGLAKEGLMGPQTKLPYKYVSPIWQKKKKLTESILVRCLELLIVKPISFGYLWTFEWKACHVLLLFSYKIDDYSRYIYVYLSSYYSEALNCFKRFVTVAENQRIIMDVNTYLISSNK